MWRVKADKKKEIIKKRIFVVAISKIAINDFQV